MFRKPGREADRQAARQPAREAGRQAARQAGPGGTLRKGRDGAARGGEGRDTTARGRRSGRKNKVKELRRSH